MVRDGQMLRTGAFALPAADTVGRLRPGKRRLPVGRPARVVHPAVGAFFPQDGGHGIDSFDDPVKGQPGQAVEGQ